MVKKCSFTQSATLHDANQTGIVRDGKVVDAVAHRVKMIKALSLSLKGKG